jgi:hypothetical protein
MSGPTIGPAAHTKGDREDRLPVVEEREIYRPPGAQVQRVQDRDVAREPDRERREDDMEGDGKGELRPGVVQIEARLLGRANAFPTQLLNMSFSHVCSNLE